MVDSKKILPLRLGGGRSCSEKDFPLSQRERGLGGEGLIAP
jgi:hypothetical protein